MPVFEDNCCIHCQEKEKEDSPPEKTMSCKHAEDVCQHCLEKVQTSTEEEDAPPLPLTVREKRNRILFDSSLLAAGGAMAYFYFKLAAMAFDSILYTIGRRTRKE